MDLSETLTTVKFDITPKLLIIIFSALLLVWINTGRHTEINFGPMPNRESGLVFMGDSAPNMPFTRVPGGPFCGQLVLKKGRFSSSATTPINIIFGSAALLLLLTYLPDDLTKTRNEK